MGLSLAGPDYWFWSRMVDYPIGGVDWSYKQKSGAEKRPWPRRWRLFRLVLRSYRISGRVVLFWPSLRARDLLGSIKSSYLPWRHTQNRIQSGWIADILGERPNPVLIRSDTESRILPSSRCYQWKPCSSRGSSRENPWIRTGLLAQLHYNVVCVGAIAGWPTDVKTKLQMEFCLAFWPRRSQNGLCIASKIVSNPCVSYHSKSPGTGP